MLSPWNQNLRSVERNCSPWVMIWNPLGASVTATLTRWKPDVKIDERMHQSFKRDRKTYTSRHCICCVNVYQKISNISWPNHALSLRFWIVKDPLHPTEFFLYGKPTSIAPIISTAIIPQQTTVTNMVMTIPDLTCTEKNKQDVVFISLCSKLFHCNFANNHRQTSCKSNWYVQI